MTGLMEEEGSYVLFITAKEFQGLNDQDHQ